jgi:hypothetical protein
MTRPVTDRALVTHRTLWLVTMHASTAPGALLPRWFSRGGEARAHKKIVCCRGRDNRPGARSRLQQLVVELVKQLKYYKCR